MSTRKLPDYEEIFGEIDIKEADDSRSVSSPAAYLCDLLQMKDKCKGAVVASDKSIKLTDDQIDLRRGDIENILFDHDNTFGMKPLLDIANRVMEDKVSSINSSKPAMRSPESIIDSCEEFPTEVYASASTVNYGVNNARFPLDLPVNIYYEKIKLLLGKFGTNAKDLYRLFEKKPGLLENNSKANIIAMQMIGLSKEEYDVIVDDQFKAVSDDVLKSYWGINPPFGLSVLIDAKTFCAKAKISYMDMLGLINQGLADDEIDKGTGLGFFINNGLKTTAQTSVLGAYLSISDSGQFQKSYLNASNHTVLIGEAFDTSTTNNDAANLMLVFDKLHRFLRLASKLSWSYADLDYVLVSACKSSLDSNAIRYIAAIKYLADTYDLALDLACSLWVDIKSFGRGNGKKSVALFDRMFNNKFKTPLAFDPVNGIELVGATGIRNQDNWKRIVSGLKISDKKLEALFYLLGSRVDSSKVHSADISLMYRLVNLSKFLGIGYADIKMLSEIVSRYDAAINNDYLLGNDQLSIDPTGSAKDPMSIADMDVFQLLTGSLSSSSLACPVSRK